MKSQIILPLYVLCFSLLLFTCSKNNDDSNEELPVFGTCEPVAFTGNLSQSIEDNTITYLTSGGGKIKIDGYTFTFTYKDYPNLSIQFWGITHENLNGKHIKDFLDNRRSLIFPDGAKITIVNGEFNNSRLSVSIHDGNEYHHFNNNCKILEYSSVNSPYAKKMDDAEADGETATFEITETGLLFYNIYTEDTPGNKIEKNVPLGEIYKNETSRVTDYFDDLRLGST